MSILKTELERVGFHPSEISETEGIDLIEALGDRVKDSVGEILTRKKRKQIRKGTLTLYGQAAPKASVKNIGYKRKQIHKAKSGKKRDTNVEHLVPKSRNGTYALENLKESDIKKHAGKHCRIGVQLAHEQIQTIIKENYQSFDKDYRDMMVEEIEKVLEFYLENRKLYDEKCFQKGYMPVKLTTILQDN